MAPPSLLAGLTSVKGQTLEARVFSGIFPKNCVEVREVLGDTGAVRPEYDPGNTPENLSYPDTNGSLHRRPSSVRHGSLGGLTNGIGSISRKRSIADSTRGPISRPAQPHSRNLSHKSSDSANLNELARKVSLRSSASRISRASVVPINPEALDARDVTGSRPPAPVPMLKIGDETPTSASEPLVDEIASCLREWHSTKLHELLLARRYSVLEKVSTLVQQLDTARRQLLHGVLTDQELERLRVETVWNLVNGNKMLSEEVIVRDPQQRGRLLTGNDSVVEMSTLQSTMSLLDEPPGPTSDPITLHHLAVDLKDLVHHNTEPVTLILCLYSKSPGEPSRPISECFTVKIGQEDQFKKTALAGKHRTLFTDLTPGDVGEIAGSNTQIYLAVKVQASQPIRQAPPPPSRMLTTRDGNSSNRGTPSGNENSSISTKGGRRSIMWAQKQFSSSYRSRTQYKPTLDQLPAEMDGSSSMERDDRPYTPLVPRPATQQGERSVAKHVGAGVINIRQLLSQAGEAEQTMVIWRPASSFKDDSESEREWNSLISELIESRSGKFEKYTAVDRIHFHLHSFLAQEADSLIKKTPTLLHNIHQTPKIGVSGAPTKPRSDIYLTVSEAILPAQSSLLHPERGSVSIPMGSDLHNTQLTLEVRKSTGEKIERCIFPSSNSPGHTAWRTTAVDRGKSWNETIKLVINSDDVPDAHLIMSIANGPEFPFALSWMPLWDQQGFVKDGSHFPFLYSYDKTTSSTDNGRGAYLGIPWNSKEGDGFFREESTSSSNAVLKLETFLCSTEFSQDLVLLGLLKWKEQTESQVFELLKQFAFVPEIEIVKQLDNVFNALFAILVAYSGKEDYEDAVLTALITVLSITHDRRFIIGPLVDEYAEGKFDHPSAAPCLIRSCLRLLSNPTDSRKSRDLRAALKVGRQILRFIFVAREKQKVHEAELGIGATSQAAFAREIRSMFSALEVLMRDSSPILVGTKTLIVQYMHTLLPELAKNFGEEVVLEIAVGFLDACADVKGKLILYKLVCILNLTKCNFISQDELCQQLVTKTAEWIDPYWGLTNDATDQWRDQVRLCCSIVISQVSSLGSHAFGFFLKTINSYRAVQSMQLPKRDNLSLLFPMTYPFPMKPVSSRTIFDETLVELSALMSSFSYADFFDVVKSHDLEDLASTCFTGLDVTLSMLANEAFPSSWISLNVYHHRTIQQSFETLFKILEARFLPSPEDADSFNTELWKSFLVALLKLVRSDALALETFPEQKRRAVWKIAGDVREHGADLLLKSWEAIGWDASPDDQKMYGLRRLGGYQVQYVPRLVGSIVELCLSVHEGLRRVAVGVLQSMIISEWTLSEDLSVIQAEMIDCLDQMFKSKYITESVQHKIFVSELLNLFEPLAYSSSQSLWIAVKELVSTVEELLDLLVAVHSVEATEAFRVMHTLRLMEFLKTLQKEDIFIRYVHQLADVQESSHNPTEAGLALTLHANLYPWDSSQSVKGLSDPALPEQSAFERKELLYFEMIRLFEDGSEWSYALESYRELAYQYETFVFDYAKLARAQRSMAKIHELIAKDDRQAQRYFRVVYRGLGFPSNLRDKQFIFQGAPSERLSSFKERIQQLHPSAHISKREIEDVEGQFLQIYAVNVHRDLNHPVYQQSKVPQSTRDYLLSSKPGQFAETSRRQSSKSSIKEQWIEKTIYSTAESFPTILRRSEIVSVNVLSLSPLQTALERTSRKTSDLVVLRKAILNGDESSFTALTEAIKSSVDPSSISSVSKYRELLPLAGSEDAQEDDPVENQSSALENALKIALLDHTSTLKNCINLYSRPAQQATRNEFSSQLHLTYSPELALLAPQPQAAASSPPPTWLPLSSAPEPVTLNHTPSVTKPTNPPLLTNGDRARTTSDLHQDTHPRNRLSLSFLKRSHTDDPSQTNGNFSHSPLSFNQTPAVDGSKANGNDRSSSLTNSHAESDTRRSGSTREGRPSDVTGGKKSTERPGTAHSAAMTFATTSSAGKGSVAAVRKRLSLMGAGIGRMGGKASFGNNGANRVESLREEE